MSASPTVPTVTKSAYKEHAYTAFTKKAATKLKHAKAGIEKALTTYSLFSTILTSLQLVEKDTLPKAPPIFKGIGLFCSAFQTPGYAVNIYTQASKKAVSTSDKLEKMLLVAKEITNLACGIMTCFELYDYVTNACATISESLGLGAQVIGDGISTLAPFTVVFSGIKIGKATIEIGIESVALYRLHKKTKAVKEKTALWQNMKWDDPSYARGKIEHMQAKQIQSNSNLNKLEGALNTSMVALNAAHLHTEKVKQKLFTRQNELKNSLAIVRMVGQIAPKIRLTFAELKQEGFEKKFSVKSDAYQKAAAKHSLRTKKIQNWNTIEGKITNKTLTGSDKLMLNNFKDMEIAKLKTKKSNLRLEKIKVGLKIALKVVVVVSLIASIVLTFTGFGTLPGLITSFTIMLFLTAAKYGLKKFDQHYQPNTWLPFHIPALKIP